MHRVPVHSGLAVAFLVLAGAGCSSTSGSALPAAARSLSPAAVQASPETYRGQTVTLGGTIVAIHARPDGADIEVVGRPLDGAGRPERGDRATGRFIVRSAEVRDATTYAPGRSITAAGWVAPMESWWADDGSSDRYPVLTHAWGPAPYVPLVTTW